MEERIKQILKDIYSVEPGLKSKEDILIGIIQDLLAANPKDPIDDEFVSNLKTKLLLERSKLMELKPINSMFNIFSKKIIFGGAAALSVLALAVFLTLQDRGGGQLVIKESGKEAFGKILLSPMQNQDGAALEASGSASPMAKQDSSTAPLGLGGEGEAPSKMIFPYPYEVTNYRYVYNGGDFEISPGWGNVYRRTADGSIGSQLAGVLAKMDLSMVDLSKFHNMRVNILELSEDKEYGYSLYIDFRQNTLSINMNWEKWPARENLSQPVQMSDQELINLADSFLADYGINRSNYGSGEIQKTQQFYIMKGESASTGAIMPERYTRDYATVIYPMGMRGEQVYDQSGQKYGLVVSIDLAYKKVTSAYNINIGSFESSIYDLETDVGKIIKLVEAGGMYGGGYYYADAIKTIDIEVGKPERGLMLTWQWDPAKPYSSELFVPMLVFPITPQVDFYRTNIMIPLVGELLNQNDGIRPLLLEAKPAQ